MKKTVHRAGHSMCRAVSPPSAGRAQATDRAARVMLTATIRQPEDRVAPHRRLFERVEADAADTPRSSGKQRSVAQQRTPGHQRQVEDDRISCFHIDATRPQIGRRWSSPAARHEPWIVCADHQRPYGIRGIKRQQRNELGLRRRIVGALRTGDALAPAFPKRDDLGRSSFQRLGSECRADGAAPRRMPARSEEGPPARRPGASTSFRRLNPDLCLHQFPALETF